LKILFYGILFAIFWASASTAAKIGMQSAEPLFLFNVRFFIAGILMLLYAYFYEKQPLPHGKEWLQLTLFGLLNVTIYLGFFVVAVSSITAGIGTLGVATNPLIISILSALWIGRKVRPTEWLAIVLGMVGVGIATYPLIQNNHADLKGLVLLGLSMISYSVGTIYYSKINWKLSITAINGWQVFIGGILSIPITFIFHERANHFDLRFWFSELWLAIPVSIIAVQLWLYLLKIDTVKASLFLFLCPIFGFIYSNLLLGEPITLSTIIGTILVLIGLYIGKK
jgi:probable blue pigment (indigoidine) exporter